MFVHDSLHTEGNIRPPSSRRTAALRNRPESSSKTMYREPLFLGLRQRTRAQSSIAQEDSKPSASESQSGHGEGARDARAGI